MKFGDEMKCLGSGNVGDVSKSYNGSGKRKSGCAKFLYKHQTIYFKHNKNNHLANNKDNWKSF